MSFPLHPCTDCHKRTTVFLFSTLISAAVHGNPWLLYGPVTTWLPKTEWRADLGDRIQSLWPSVLTHKAVGQPDVLVTHWGLACDLQMGMNILGAQ